MKQKQPTQARSRTRQLIEELNKLHEHGCQDVLLIDQEGLIVAATSNSLTAQDTAALAAQMVQMADRTSGKVQTGDSDEITIRTSQEMKLVCRSFTMGRQPVALVCTLPYKLRHRRATNKAIRSIQQVWTGAANGSART